MDVQTALIYVGVVVVSAAVILLVSMFGIKEKSYEEAIAEQRKLPDDLLSNKKDKNKEKKHKNKSGKKVKEKKEERDEKDEKEEKSEHVQFEETPQILPPELPPVQEKASKKKGKPEKVKPILVNKDEPLAIMTESSPSQALVTETNHFDLIQPKDDLELIRSHSKENLQQIGQSESAVSKSPKDTPTKVKKSAKETKEKKKEEITKDEKKEANNISNINIPSVIVKEVVKENKETLKETPVKEQKEVVEETIIPHVQSTNKESKKNKKKPNDILAHIDGDKDRVNVSLLSRLIQKAELSSSEIQDLTDQLLNKQLDSPSEHSEWTEGRADPVIKLKKQLTEKEKALTDEREANVALQNKLKDLRAEFKAEKSGLASKVKELEEELNVKRTETQTLSTRMQHILESHVAEKQGFNRRIEQLEAKIKEDTAIIHKMQEDQGQTQGQMQQELIAQRKQMEVQFAQMHENENALKAQLTQKHVEVQELQATYEHSMTELDMMRQQLGIMQNQLMHTEGQLQHFKEAGDRLQEVTRQLEESHRAHADLDHRFKNSHRHEQELQKQVNSLQAELNMMKEEASKIPSLKSELSKTQSELMKLESELSLSKNEAKSEAVEITTLKAALCNKEEELKKYREEFDVLHTDLRKSKEEFKQLQYNYNESLKELEMLKKELEKSVNNLRQAQEEIIASQSQTRKLQEELIQSRNNLENYQDQIKAVNDTSCELTALKAEINRLQNGEKKSSEVQLQLTRLQEENDRLSAQLCYYAEMQKEVQQLREENESLASQLTATTERPAAEGRENGIEEKMQKSNLQLIEHENLLAQKESQLDELKTELTRKEAELNRLSAQINALQSDMNDQNGLVKQLKNDLEVQRSKNNEVAQKIKADQEELTKAFLKRVFPEITVSENTYEKWINAFENKVQIYLNDTKSKNIVPSDSDMEKQNKNLQGMVSHYKQIIDDTEGMLNKLQNNIESEETRWRAQLQQKENEVSNLRVELDDLRNKLSTNEKLHEKISELEARLRNAESYKQQGNTELSVLRLSQRSVANGSMYEHDLAALEKLQEEKARLSRELQTETNKRATLDAEVARLRTLVESSESSLAQEKNLVAQLQQEVSQLKNEICGGCSSSEQSMLNGPPTSDSPVSETPLAAQTLIAALESTLRKNTEFANCSITKSMNLVQTPQEIENSSFSTKYSSKSCHMTDHNTQASWNPLIGQQHKKHKKKRKGGSGKK